MIRSGKTGEVVTIDGLGVWPKQASSEYFRKNHGGKIPEGLKRCVVPGAPSGWITALETYGTMSFGDVASAAIRLAHDGFPADPRFVETIVVNEKKYRRFAENTRIFLPNGKPPTPGDMVRQVDLALLNLGRITEGERVVIVAGVPPGVPGTTNGMRVHRIGHAVV